MIFRRNAAGAVQWPHGADLRSHPGSSREAWRPVRQSALGVYCLFMGLMRIAEQTGFATWTAKLCRRPLARLFPSLRGNREALGSIAMNISANLLGMGNAATPFGLKAMADFTKKSMRIR